MAEKPEERRSAPELPDHLAKDLEDGQEASLAAKKSTDKQDDAEEKTELDDPKVDQAVEDIVRGEGDDLLASQDAEKSKAEQPSARKKHWFSSKKFWWTLFFLVLLGAGTAAAFPTSRYWMLDRFNVRASASVVVVDDNTQQPLKNVQVTIGKTSAKTDGDGKASFKQLKLGPTTLTIERIAFEGVKKQLTIGWGSNPLDQVALKATGNRQTVLVRDYLSGKPIAGVEVSVDQASALSDKDGKAVVTLDARLSAAEVVATVRGPGYRAEEVTLSLESAEPSAIALVPSNKAIFMTRETGRYDVYAMDIDGQNKKLLLAGTGKEGANTTLVVSPAGDRAALVSTRDNVLGSDGHVLNTLTLITVADGSTLALDRGTQLQVIDWVNDRLIYQVIGANANAAAADRQRIVSYGYQSETRLQLAAANQFKVVTAARGAIYYATVATEKADAVFAKVKPDGSGTLTITDTEVWSAVRTNYNTLSLQMPNGWQAYDMQKNTLAAATQPASLTSRQYIDNPAATDSLWAASGTLNHYAIAAAKDKALRIQSGLGYPLRWLTDTIAIYRVANSQETVDYAISINGGEPRKLSNVTGTYGFPAGF